jgi:hypothetical protein
VTDQDHGWLPVLHMHARQRPLRSAPRTGA